jgi:organic hydroperoxide reductase OsmC/OhrA
MSKIHPYTLKLTWTGNLGNGTRDYRSYERAYRIQLPGKAALLGSADPAFLGDPALVNPEEMLLAALSSCHMLWYLHLCAEHKITVMHYQDQASGEMIENTDGSGAFAKVTLQPEVAILEYDQLERSISLHQEASNKCFIARSVNFPVSHLAKSRHYAPTD